MRNPEILALAQRVRYKADPAFPGPERFKGGLHRGWRLADDREGPLFGTGIWRTGVLTDRAMSQSDAWRKLQRRTQDAGIPTAVGNHTFRATGITSYLDDWRSPPTRAWVFSSEAPAAPTIARTNRSRSMGSKRLEI